MFGKALWKALPNDWKMNQKKLKFMLDEIGIRHNKLAEITGKDGALVHRWLTGERPMPKEDEEKIKSFFSKFLSE